MVSYKHNEAYYELKFSELDEENINVLSFEGEEEISHLFEFRIEFISKNAELDSSKILNKKAVFILNRGDEDPIKVHGIISHFEQFGSSADYIFYKVVLVPQIWRLNLVFQNEVYQNVNIQDIIEMISKDIDLSDYMIDLKNIYPQKEYIVQYKETDLNFLNRRLEHYGIYYYFDHSGDMDFIVFTDSNTNLKALPLKSAIGYNVNKDPLSENESISEINCREKIVTGMVQLKDYNYLFPEKQLMSQSQINSSHPGMFYDFGDDFTDENEAESLAKIRNQEILCKSKIFNGKSDCRYFSAGYKFKLDKHYRKNWNGEYIITKVSHKGNQYGLFGLLPNSKKISPTYENYFTAIPVDIEYRPSRRTPVPKINGIMSAKIDTAEGDDIYIDDHGRYKAKMLFDVSDKKNGEASSWIRLTQNYSGAGYGIHFPNHKDTELLWACVDGNVDRPIGLGTVPNPSNASPSISGNKTQSVIRTAANNEIVIEDKDGDEQIHINQECGNEIHMKASGPDIEIKQKCGNQILMKEAGPDIEIKQACGNQIVMKEAEGIDIKDKYGNEIKLDAASGFIHIGSPTHNSFLDIGKSIKWGTDSDDISFTAGHKLETGLGSKNDIIVGARTEVTQGFKKESVYGVNIALNYAIDVVKNYKDAERKSTGNIKYDSEKQITLIGGAGDESQVILNKNVARISSKGIGRIDIEKGGIKIIADASKPVIIEGKDIMLKATNDIVLNAGRKVIVPKGKFDDKGLMSQ